jgi:hypothetical protein
MAELPVVGHLSYWIGEIRGDKNAAASSMVYWLHRCEIKENPDLMEKSVDRPSIGSIYSVL